MTNRRYVGLDLATIVERLNRSLRGWANYFRWGNSSAKFTQIDAYAHERLAIWMSNKHSLRGRNWTTRYTYSWRLSTGLVRIAATPANAHAAR